MDNEETKKLQFEQPKRFPEELGIPVPANAFNVVSKPSRELSSIRESETTGHLAQRSADHSAAQIPHNRFYYAGKHVGVSLSGPSMNSEVHKFPRNLPHGILRPPPEPIRNAVNLYTSQSPSVSGKSDEVGNVSSPSYMRSYTFSSIADARVDTHGKKRRRFERLEE